MNGEISRIGSKVKWRVHTHWRVQDSYHAIQQVEMVCRQRDKNEDFQYHGALVSIGLFLRVWKRTLL